MTAFTPGLIIAALAYAYFAVISVVLTVIDLRVRRLPNAIVLPSYLVVLALFTVACLVGMSWDALLRAVIAGAALFVFYLVLRLIRPAGMGGGDVKLAGVIGMLLGWLGWGSFAVGAFAAFLLGGLFGLALVLTRRGGRKTSIPFGPWMIAGAWVGILTGQRLADWYLGLLMGV